MFHWQYRLVGPAVHTQSLSSQICVYKHTFFTYGDVGRTKEIKKKLGQQRMTRQKEIFARATLGNLAIDSSVLLYKLGVFERRCRREYWDLTKRA